MLRAQQGDVDGFTEVVARFEKRLFNFISRRVGKRSGGAEAEDLTQETFLRAWRSLGDYQPRHRFSTWLFTIASRLVVDHLRHMAVRNDSFEDVGMHAHQRRGTLDASGTGEEADHVADGRRLWNIAADILTHEQHAALWLRYAEDLSPAEVARVLDRNEVAVRVMLFRARQAIAGEVNQNLKSQSDVAVAAGGIT